MLSSKNSFISLVRPGIGHPADFFPKDVDWNNLKALAMRQGLSAVLLDGLEKIPENRRPTKDLMLQWIGEVMQSYEARYRQYAKAIGELAELYQKHEIKMMVLKGYACSQDWPKPEHRPCGDIDIWQFGKQNEADAFGNFVATCSYRNGGASDVRSNMYDVRNNVNEGLPIPYFQPV